MKKVWTIVNELKLSRLKKKRFYVGLMILINALFGAVLYLDWHEFA